MSFLKNMNMKTADLWTDNKDDKLNLKFSKLATQEKSGLNNSV